MLQKAKDYITWGEADAGMVERMLTERGACPERTADRRHRCRAHRLQEHQRIAKAITAGEAQVKDIPGLKRVFRFPPWNKGWGGIKRSLLLVEPSAPVAMPLATLSTE